MSMDLAQLKAMRKSAKGNLEQIAKTLQKQSEKKSYKDEKIWGVERDKAGNGTALVRLLPAHPEDELPWVKTFSHGFQGPTGQWYIENCLTTIGKEDPVVNWVSNEIVNGRKWDDLSKAEQDRARVYKRKAAYYFNVLIIDDPANPENNGQVKIFKCGQKIYEMVMGKINPEFEDMQPVDVFDPWEGANFRIRMRKVDGYANFDKSEFLAPSEITDDDEELLNILNSRYRLSQYIDADQFKTFEELQERFDKVMSGGRQQERAENEKLPSKEEPKKREVKEPAKKEVKEKVVAGADEDDEDMKFFQNLVNDDDSAFNPDDEIPF